MSQIKQRIIGAIEKVSFPEFGAIGTVSAKIDTGAYTGALHCTKIEEVIGRNGTQLQFSPFDHPEVVIKCREYEKRRVRSSNGLTETRYAITTRILIQDREFPISLTLANRAEMKWPVLIGRKFLATNHFLVDVRAIER